MLVSMSQPALTMAEVAELCDVSPSTVKRRKRSGAFPNAYQEPGPNGRVLIPVNDLALAGLQMQPQAPAEPGGQQEVTDLTQRAVTAEADAAHWRALAGERDRTIALLTTSLRMLEAAPAAPAPPMGRFARLRQRRDARRAAKAAANAEARGLPSPSDAVDQGEALVDLSEHADADHSESNFAPPAGAS